MKLALVFSTLLGLVACSPSGPAPGATHVATSTAASVSAPHIFKVGETMYNGGLGIAVVMTGIANSIGPAYGRVKASQGGELVVVETEIKNVGSKPVAADALPHVQLVAPDGTLYSEDYGKTAAARMEDQEIDRKLASDLNPDIVIKDVAVFEVSKAQFNFDTWYMTPGGGTLVAFKSYNPHARPKG